MPTLPDITCVGCHRRITSESYTPAKKGGAASATDYDSCLRKCDACGFGFSNADTGNASELAIIYRDPFWDVPRFIEEGYDRVLAKALNEHNRPAKQLKFASSNSEDHVTWTVFQHLIRVGELAALSTKLGWITQADQEPKVLFWGVSVSTDRTCRGRLKNVSDRLGERQSSRSEPDVILDFGSSGLVFIEVKLRSRNSSLNGDSPKPARYLEKSDAFIDAKKANASGLYELIRNWRILCEVAGDAPATLVNLGPAGLGLGLAEAPLDLFRASLNLNGSRRFMTTSWDKFLEAIDHPPLWLNRYIRDRKIVGAWSLDTNSA